MLLADVIDELRFYRHEFGLANGAKGGKVPSQVDRPGTKGKARKKPMSMEQRRQLDPRLRGEWNG